jgi:aldose 1-epimerase
VSSVGGMADGAGLWRLDASGASALVDVDRGGRLVSLRIDDVEVIGGADEPGSELPFLDGCFPRVPYAGRVGHGELRWDGVTHRLPLVGGPHAIHGTVLDRVWQRDGDVLRCDLGPDWPWSGWASQRWTLDAEGLTAVLTLGADDVGFPAWIGYHPWFRRRVVRPDGVVVVAELEVRPARMYRRGPDGLPTGELVAPGPQPWDDCVVGLGAAPSITWAGWLRLTVASDASHWVVYDARPEAICVEPQTGPPDALRLGEATVVPAHGTVSLTMRLSWARLRSRVTPRPGG